MLRSFLNACHSRSALCRALWTVLLFAACRNSTGPVVTNAPATHDYFRFSWQGEASDTVEFRGVAYVPADNQHDFVAFTFAGVNSTRTRSIVFNRALSIAGNGGFDFGHVIVNPVVLADTGRYEPSDCATSPDIGGCAQVLFNFGRVFVNGSMVVSTTATLISVPHSITLHITEITPVHVRGTLSGQFTYRKNGVGVGVLVTVTDASFDASNVVTRTPAPCDS